MEQVKKNTSSVSASQTQAKREPFFSKEGSGNFFSKSNEASQSFFSPAVIQPKLTVNQPNDPYEREADAMADKVVQRLSSKSPDNSGLAPAPVFNNPNSFIQRKCAGCEQEEKLQKKEDSGPDVLKGRLQKKPIFESNAEPDDEKNVQRKCAECEKEEKIQEKSDGSALPMPVSGIESNLVASKGLGSPLPHNTREKMESSFGTDFSGVRIHNDSTAVSMNKALQAKAFTHGSDIYFNSGQYDMNGKGKEHLLAHELTHVIQQNPPVHSYNPVQRQVADKIPETQNQFYGHGAFMGAAPQLMADAKWNRILQVLMPDVHADATKALSKGPQSDELILMFENNPVMAAYGMYKTKQMDVKRENGRSDRISKMEAIEWDVFLPTTIVEEYTRAKTDKEKARLAHEMVGEMIIAHGTFMQTVEENAGGWFGSRQYENVKKTAKSDQGGVRPGAWMDLFGKSLELATDVNWEKKAKEYENPALHPRVDSPDDQAAHQTFKDQLSFQKVISLYKRMFNKETFSVLLDIKSRDATPMILGALVGDLNLRGIRVYGVGTFKHDEIKGLGKIEQKVDGKTYSGLKEVKFFHFAGDLQNACLANEISEGDTVMFNAGSLISYKSLARGKKTKASYKIKTDVVSQLRIYKQHYGFHLGVYVQENDIDDRAATLITEATNSHPDIFDLGFAWGGLSGQTASDIEPSLTHATVGTYNQAWPGTHWDTGKTGPSLLAVASKEAPLISELTFQETQSLIRQREFGMALDVVVKDLIAHKTMDPALFTIGFEDSYAHGEGLTNGPLFYPDNSGNYIPKGKSEVTIYSKAFTSVQWLLSTIMHEYQHVLQYQRTRTASDFIENIKGGTSDELLESMEVESYLWELENAASTGMIEMPGSLKETFRRLTDHYNTLGGYNKTRQARYKLRYEAVKAIIQPLSSEEEKLAECDKTQYSDKECIDLRNKVIDRFGGKKRKKNFNPDTDVDKSRTRVDDAPLIETFRIYYNRLDSWDVYMRRKHPDLYDEFTTKFQLNQKRNAWLADLKEENNEFKAKFRDVQRHDVEKERSNFEAEVKRKIEHNIQVINIAIAYWYMMKTGTTDDVNTVIEKVHLEGTKLWREEWLEKIFAVNRILSVLWPPTKTKIIQWVTEQRKLHPRVDLKGDINELDYIGSLSAGYKGAPKQFIRFNVNKFDVDANIVALPLAKYAMKIDGIKPDRERIFTLAQGTSITPLNNFCYDAQNSLSSVPGYDAKEAFDVVIWAPATAEQAASRKGTEKIYKLRTKLGETKYNEMVTELKSAGLLVEAEKGGFILKNELSREEPKDLNKILKKYEQ